MSHAGTEEKFLKTLFPKSLDGLKMLDIGYGHGGTGLYIRTLDFNGWCELHGVEIYQPYYLLQQKLGIYDMLVYGDAKELDYPDGFFDLSIAQQVIEHENKEDGLKLLHEAERVTKGRVIFCTPNGYHKSHPGRDGNMRSEHRSGWTVNDFKKLGYNTRIVSKNVNSRAVALFAKTFFMLQGKTWENSMIVAWRDV